MVTKFFDGELRNQVVKYLDENNAVFDNNAKAQICMVNASAFKERGLHRKAAFFSRLAILFKLNNDNVTEKDYQMAYPIMYNLLPGYGVDHGNTNVSIKGSVAIQVKVLHEVYMIACRAGFRDAAIRHLCYILQVYLSELYEPSLIRMLEELQRIVKSQPKPHSLSQSISLEQSGIMLPPLQMTRFPTLSDFKIVRLAPSLAPRILPTEDASQKIFIYSPFQIENGYDDIYWVTNCRCEVSVKVLNPLPINLIVRKLVLLTEGCTFEAIPIKLTFTAYTMGTQPTEIKLIGIPRAPGKLTITGYSCEVLGVRNVCSIKEILPKNTNADEKSSKSAYTVEVLQELPLLTLESSLQRAPTTEDHSDPVAETTVFSGQTFEHSVFIVNTNESTAIKSVKLDIRQPTVFGPALIQLTNMSLTKEENHSINFGELKPGERREIKFQIFGIDPASISDDKSTTEEQKVMLKTSFATFNGDNSSTLNVTTSFTDETSMLLPNISKENDDFCTYIGRVFTSDFLFRYVPDTETVCDIKYERTARLPLAICIVPAVTVSHWHVLPGDSASTRYVVLDVTNSTDLDTELTYSTEEKIRIQPKKTCQLSVLCPCCPDISSRDFQEAIHHDSYVKQKQEIDILRRSLDSHIAKHLQIRWAIPQLNYSGIVPIGSVLAEVEFLKQLVVPTVSVYVTVNGKAYSNDEEITVSIGELTELDLTVTSVLKEGNPIKGELSLRCYQVKDTTLIDKFENFMLCGPLKVPIIIESLSLSNYETQENVQPSKKETTAQFSFLFLSEGTYKIRPVIGKSNAINEPTLAEDEIFVPTITFKVVTKVS